MNIFQKIKQVTKRIELDVEKNKSYGFALINQVFDQVDFCFKDLSESQKDIIIMRVYDNLERINIKFYF